MLSFKFLIQHVIHILEFRSKRYSAAVGFPQYMGVRAGSLCHDEHQNQESESS